MLHCRQCREITDSTHSFWNIAFKFAKSFFYENHVFNISFKKNFLGNIISFPSKFWRIFQMLWKTHKQTNKQTNKHFQTHTRSMETETPSLENKISAAERFKLAIFGSQIKCVFHSANMILFWKRVIFSSILRKYCG